MTLSTTYRFNAKPEQIWPLLFDSKMDEKHPCFFLCGLPKPVECRLTEGGGGVGKTRECVSDKGVIRQEITEWQPNRLLAFRMQETTIYFGPCVKSIEERFELQPISEGKTTVTRRTVFEITSPARVFLSLPLLIGLKSIHHYVFRNWRKIAAERKHS
jgi:hypothetical protein